MNTGMTNIFINDEPVFVDDLPKYTENCRVFDFNSIVDKVRIIDGFETRMDIGIKPIDILFFDTSMKRLGFKNGNDDILISYQYKIVIINISFGLMIITMIEEPRVQYTKPFVMFNRQYGNHDFRHVHIENAKELLHSAPFTDLYIYIKNHVPVYIKSDYARFRPIFPENIDKIVKFVEAYDSGKIKSIEYNGEPHDLKSVDFIYGKINIDINGKEFKSIPIENVITGEIIVTYNEE